MADESYDFIAVVFRAEIKLTPEDIKAAGGDQAQAVQNEIGHTGAQVIDVDEPASTRQEA